MPNNWQKLFRMILIIDYGLGNLSSIANMFRKLGINSKISNDINDLKNATKVILPGVGHFDYGMNQLHATGFVDILNSKVLDEKTPILGICLGAQLLTQRSDEGKCSGLGWIKGETVSFDRLKLSNNLKVPHMGWAEVKEYEKSKLFTDMHEKPRFYFVHSYHLKLDNSDDIMLKATHGYDFVAGIEHDNIVGVQFHPEKSHKYGMKILENFANCY